MPTRLQDASREISIHALREEGDFTPLCNLDLSWSFLSTPSARRATRWSTAGARSSRHFYPRPPRGGRRCPPTALPASCSHFYPRPPRGGRPDLLMISKTSGIFLSTPSARRATLELERRLLRFKLFLSTPSARRATLQRGPPAAEDANFYPRPPRGGRRFTTSCGFSQTIFLSTPSARRATDRRRKPLAGIRISIHALREEGDPYQPARCWCP